MAEYEIHFETGDVIAIEGDKPPGPEAISAVWADYQAGRGAASDLSNAGKMPVPEGVGLRGLPGQALEPIPSGTPPVPARTEIISDIRPTAKPIAKIGQPQAPNITNLVGMSGQGFGQGMPEPETAGHQPEAILNRKLMESIKDPIYNAVAREVLLNVAGLIVGGGLGSLGRIAGTKIATLLANSAMRTNKAIQVVARAAPGVLGGAGFFGGMRGTVEGSLAGAAKGAALGGLVGAVGLLDLAHPVLGWLARAGIITGGDVALDSERYKLDSLGGLVQTGINLTFNGLFALGKAPRFEAFVKKPMSAAITEEQFRSALDTLDRIIKTKGRAAAIETPEGAEAFKTIQEVLGGPQANQQLRNLINKNVGRTVEPKPAGRPEAVRALPAPTKQPTVQAVPKPNKPPIQATVGRDTRIVVENEAPQPARYALIEADQLIPSHAPWKGFAPHAQYPRGIQERNYQADKQAQAEIQVRAQEGGSPRNMDPSRLITDNPTPVEGPPIITPSGLVLGGNSRAMTIILHYLRGGQLYRQYLLENASRFGLDPAEAARMNAPVLVRLRGEAPGQQEAQRLIRQYNQVGTRELSAAERAATTAKNVSSDTLEMLAQRLDAGGDIATIRSVLGKSPRYDGDLVNRLVVDGVLTPGEVKRYLVAGRGLTEDGKRLIEDAVLGTVIKDAGALATTPPFIREKIGKALGPIAAIKARGEEWNILPDLARGAEIATRARQMDIDVDGFLSQQSMFGGTRYSDVAVGLARLLMDKKTKPLVDALKRWASFARTDVKNQAAMFGKPTPAAASREIFGVEAAPDVAEIQYLKTGRSIYRENPLTDMAETTEKPVSLNTVVEGLKNLFETIALKGPLNRYDEAFYLTIKDVIKYKKNQAFFHEIGHVVQNPRKPFAEPLRITPRHLKKFTGELAGLDPDQPLTEGFAEFMRLWITDYNQAMQRAPNLLAHFEKNASQDLKMWAALNRFREMTEAYFAQSTYADIAGMVGPIKGGPISMRQRMDLAKKAWDDVITGVFNKDHPVFKLEDRVVRALGDMLPTENFGLALEALRGVGVKSFDVLDHGLLNDPAKPSQRVTFDARHLGKTGEMIPGKTPLIPREILRRLENELERERFAVYILAKRAGVYEEKRAMRLFGENVAKGGPAKVVAELDKTHPHFARLAIIWDAISKTLLEYKWRSGLVDTKLFHLLHDEYPFYVSFGRYMDDILGTYQGAGLTGVRQLIKKIGESERQIRSPYESLLKDIFETYHIGDRNRFFVLLDKAVEKMPGVWIEEKPPRYFKSWTDDKGVKHTQITYGRVGPDVIDFYKNGKRVYRKVLDAPLLRSLKSAGDSITASLKGINGAASKLVDAILFAPARIKRAGMTKSPGWILWNFFRDGLTVAMTSEAGYVQVPWLRGILSLPRVVLQTKGFNDLMASGMGGSTLAGFNQELYARTLQKMTERIRAGGGKVVENPAQLMALALKNAATLHPIRTAKTTWEIAEILSQASEYANRVGEAKAVIKRYMKAGMSYDDALILAMRAGRRVSVDFQQHGAWAVTQLLTSGTPFLTSSLQGKLRWAETYFSPKNAMPGGLTGRKKLIRNWTRLFLYTVLPVLIVWATHKDDPKWQSLEPWQKFGYLNFRLGGQMVSLPKNWEFAVISNVVEGVLTDLQAKDGRAAGNLAWNILNAFDISPDRYVPQFARLILEPLVGASFWTQRPIVSGRTSGEVPENQTNFFTGPAERMLAAVLNNGFGIPLKAAYIGYMAQAFAGNIGELAIQVANAIAGGAVNNNYDLPTRDYWRRFLTGRFIKDQTTYTRAMSRFYTDWRHVSELLRSANRTDRLMRPDEADALVATKTKLWGPEFKTIWEKRDEPLGYLSGVKKLRRLISEYGAAMDRIRFSQNIPAESKQKQIHWLMYGMINAVQRFYGLEKLIVEAPVEEPDRALLERQKTRWNKPAPPRKTVPHPPTGPNWRRQPSILDHAWSKP